MHIGARWARPDITIVRQSLCERIEQRPSLFELWIF